MTFVFIALKPSRPFIARITFFILKKSRFVEDLLFYPKNEVIAVPKNWNIMRLSQRCSCLHWVWRGNLILTILSCENTSNIWEYQIIERKCVVQTNSRVKWSEFHCLVMVLFSAIFSCFLLDSFELQEMFCLTKYGATFSSLDISRGVPNARVMMNMLAIR